MKRRMTRRTLDFAILGAVAVASVAGAFALRRVVLETVIETASADPAEPAREAPADATPVLVELFTSEGCSSCPAADEVLARLERTQPATGARVIPLALHVDYWDSLGWPDPFASPAWTARQQAYARAIEAAARRPHAKVGVVATTKDGSIDVAVTVGALPAGSGGASGAPSDVEVVVAITENAARVAVPRGENAGRTLDHTAIVRDLRVAQGGAIGAGGGSAKATFAVPRGLDPKNLRVVAFAEERASRAVLGAASGGIVTR